MQEKISRNPTGQRGKDGGPVWVRLILPALLNERLIKYQAMTEARKGQKPSKSYVLIKALGEFLTRAGFILLLLPGCERGDYGTAFRLALLFGTGALVGHIVFIVKHGKNSGKS